MSEQKTGHKRMIIVAEGIILGVLCVSLLSLGLIMLRSGLSLA